LEEVEKEVVKVEEMVFSIGHETGQVPKPQSYVTVPKVSPQTDTHMTETKAHPFEKPDTLVDEKPRPHPSTANAVRTRFSLPRPTIPLFFRRFKRAISSVRTSVSFSFELRKSAGGSTTTSKLRRMARTRKLVTSLTRLLASKSEVVAQIRKRLLTTGQSGLGNGAGKDDDVEVAIYMGDVQGMSFYTTVRIFDVDYSLCRSYPDIATLSRSL